MELRVKSKENLIHKCGFIENNDVLINTFFVFIYFSSVCDTPF